MAQQEAVDSIAKIQKLRLQRMTWGLGAQFSTWLVIVGLYLFGMVPMLPAAIYFLMILTINLVFALSLIHI